MVDYLYITIKNNHAIIRTVNDSDMYSIPFENIKITDENDKIIVNRKKKDTVNYRWILRKIIIDDPGKAGDGSDAKIHSDIVFEGSLSDLKVELLKREIIQDIHSDIKIWKKFATSKGYLLYQKKEE